MNYTSLPYLTTIIIINFRNSYSIWAFEPEVGLVYFDTEYADGKGNNVFYLSTDYARTFQKLPNLESTDTTATISPRIWPCMVLVGNKLMMVGGIGGSTISTGRETYEMDLGPDQEWKSLPLMTTKRHRHMCSTVTTGAGEKEVVVVGGTFSNTATDSVEIYSVKNKEWRTGNN